MDGPAIGFEHGSRINMLIFSNYQMKGNVQTNASELSFPSVGWLKQ
jgi:hypothetical protein